MGKADISVVGDLGFHQNTLNEYDNEVSDELLDHHLSQIASAYKNVDGCACYVFGMGAQPRSTYVDLKKEAGVKLIWSGSVLSGPSKILSLVVASQAGLVKITDPDKLPLVTKTLCHLSMAGVYIFDQAIEEQFVKKVLENPLPSGYDLGVKADPRYFFYLVDADNVKSSTGIYEIISYGKEASEFERIM